MARHHRRRDFPRKARLRKREELTTTGTVRLIFDLVGTSPLRAEAGQFIGVSVPIAGARRAQTPYCVMQCTEDQRIFELLVRVVVEGPVSVYLGTMPIGTVVDFRGPMGVRMFPDDDDREIVLLPTGVGISPFVFLIETLIEMGHPAPVRMYWGLRLEDDLCLQGELAQLEAKHHDFRWEATLSQPSDEWAGMRGRITESVPPVLNGIDGQLFYFCGNGAMAEEMMTALGQLGVSHRWMHNEPFFNRRHRPDPHQIDDIVSRFAVDLRNRAVPTDPAELFPVDNPLT